MDIDDIDDEKCTGFNEEVDELDDVCGAEFTAEFTVELDDTLDDVFIDVYLTPNCSIDGCNLSKISRNSHISGTRNLISIIPKHELDGYSL